MNTNSQHTFQQALSACKEVLNNECEAEILTLAALHSARMAPISRTEFYSNLNELYPVAAFERLMEWSHRRAQGEILQYLTGEQVFLDHTYRVRPGVLVPRPETECLLQILFDEFEKYSKTNFYPKLGIEIGTGSGAISIELLTKYPQLKMIASDISPIALDLAFENADRILGAQVNRLQFICAKTLGEVWEPFDRLGERIHHTADFIISNPPYLAGDDPIEADVLTHEPKEALFPFGDPSGDSNYFYRQLAKRGHKFLNTQGMLAVEIPHQRADEIRRIFLENKHWSVKLFCDLNQRERVLVAKYVEPI